MLKDTFLALENSRLIRKYDNFYELAHDSLAKLIKSGRSEDQLIYNRLIKSFEMDYLEYEDLGTLLSAQQIKTFEPHLNKLNLGTEEINFFWNQRKW